MTITLYLQKDTLLKDIMTIAEISKYTPVTVERVRPYYDNLNVSIEQKNSSWIAIQVTAEEFTLIGVFNGGF